MFGALFFFFLVAFSKKGLYHTNELLNGHQLQVLMGMVVEAMDTKRDRIHGASMIDGLRTTLIILQLHIPIVQKVNHLRGYPKPSRPGIEHRVPNAQIHNK